MTILQMVFDNRQVLPNALGASPGYKTDDTALSDLSKPTVATEQLSVLTYYQCNNITKSFNRHQRSSLCVGR